MTFLAACHHGNYRGHCMPCDDERWWREWVAAWAEIGWHARVDLERFDWTLGRDPETTLEMTRIRRETWGLICCCPVDGPHNPRCEVHGDDRHRAPSAKRGL